MNAVDTNILIYVHDDREPDKRAAAKELINDLENGLLPFQVACEYIAASRKLRPPGYTPEHAKRDIDDLRSLWGSALSDWAVFDKSANLMSHYSLSSWDSLLIAAYLEAGVETLFRKISVDTIRLMA